MFRHRYYDHDDDSLHAHQDILTIQSSPESLSFKATVPCSVSPSSELPATKYLFSEILLLTAIPTKNVIVASIIAYLLSRERISHLGTELYDEDVLRTDSIEYLSYLDYSNRG